MMNSEFAALAGSDRDYYPAPLRDQIDQVNDRVYRTVNNGVYRCGFARKQAAYDRAVRELFDTLDWLEQRLDGHDYLVGDRPTEADWRLYPTLVRFDAVYHGHFKCNLRRLRDYPNLLAHTRRLHAEPGIAELVDFDYIKTHYYGSHESINPTGIVPAGPAQLLD
jgi:putative glutathione S-transferase